MNDVPIPQPRPADAPQAPTPPAAEDPAAVGSGTPTGTTTDSIASKPDQCIIVANGQQYKDWAQVEVTITQGEPMREGAFVATEVLPAPGLGFTLPVGQSALQLYPGMKCKIYMGGQLVLTGLIWERTANYDHSKHSVLIKCSGDNKAIVRGAVSGSSGKAMKKATWEKYTNAQLKGAGLQSVKMNAKSKAATAPFKLIQHIPGEKRFKVIDRYARSAQILLSESPAGQLVANDIKGPDGGGGGGEELQEGKNILRASCKIWNESFKNNSVGIGAQKNDDSNDHPRNKTQVATQSELDEKAKNAQPAFGAGDSPAIGTPPPAAAPAAQTASAQATASAASARRFDRRVTVSPFDDVPTPPTRPEFGAGDSPALGTPPTSMESKGPQTTSVVHSEIDSDNKTLKNRHDYQNMWEDTNFQIQAEVVVRGWLRDNGRAWDVNDQGNGPQAKATINAPMLMLKQDLLINTVKLSQTVDEGTLTTLTLSRYPSGQSPLPKQTDAKDGTPKTYDPNAPDPSTGANTGTQGGVDKSGGNPASGV